MERKIKKSGWITILSCVMFLVVATTIFVACQNDQDEVVNNDQGVEYSILEDAMVFIEPAGLLKSSGEIETLNDGSGLQVAIGHHAGLYYLPKDIKNFDVYYALLAKSPATTPNVLRITIGEYAGGSGRPIVKVEEPSKEELEVAIQKVEYMKTSSNQHVLRAQAALSSTIPSVSAMNTAFNYIKGLGCPASGTCIPFRYAADGCYARAHYMRKILAERYGYDCKKVFCIGTLKATSLSTGCCAEWVYHVAPLVEVNTGTTCQGYIFDPSLFSQPVPLNDWLNKMKQCYSLKGSITTTVTKTSNYYSYNPYAQSYGFDDYYSDTMLTLRSFANSSGCL